ncbi:ABC transporter substrate-binding protein [Streptomyces hydrogenans]|uniref:Peptide ABC transporter substrate-binding protein n=1 Tax=Streptomyces hydrogenans TaxID=1873719 RepID=A0ABQ3PMF5_9ACTN|nr:ABC transporter substrate-binding protein [Streptomyces hydrogenans]GHF97259.1 peptide ABC transporter substrate-binding protein [Streptomyces hydrogenans]GHI26211.1 peptide ABC transporter substrate-binding protein [Streptomyces hydrogenans]
MTSPRRAAGRRERVASALAVVTATALMSTSCGGGASADGARTVTLAIRTDPGSLSPLGTVDSTALMMNRFAYATLVRLAADGSTTAGAAESWSVRDGRARFVLRPGLTCEDGSPLTAADVAAGYNHVADPANRSPLLGLAVPANAGARATADESTRTVTVTTSGSAPFLVEMARMLPLVCRKALTDPSRLSRATAATGAYRLTEAVPGDHYTYVRRTDPAGTGSAPADVAGPEKLVFKVVADESTTANLLLGGQIDAGQVNGPDAERLIAAGVPWKGTRTPTGHLLFHESAARPTAAQAVRRALVGALDLKRIGSVATGGTGTFATNLGETPPTPCTGDTVTGNVPPHDPAKAAAELTGAGWKKNGGVWEKAGRPLSVTLVHPVIAGPQVTAAVELTIKEWNAFGVKATAEPVDGSGLLAALSRGDWDVAWSPISVPLPDQLTRFFDGPPPPAGSNLGSVDNPDYRRLAAEAAARPGRAGCPLWNRADAALIRRTDVTPFADSTVRTFGRGIRFEVDGGGIVPDSLRKG